MRAVLRNVAKKYQEEIADKIKIALEDEIKMEQLIQELEDRGYSKSADTAGALQIQLMELEGVP